MSWAALLLTSVLAQGYFTADEARDIHAEAVAEHQAGRSESSIALLERLVATGWTSGSLYYNLGTAYLAEGDIGRAILNLRRAQKHGAEGFDLEAQLAMARARRGGDAAPSILAVESTPIGGWGLHVVFLLAWITAVALFVTYRLGKRSAGAPSAAALGISLLLGASLAWITFTSDAGRQVVVLGSEASLWTGSGPDATPAAELDPGEELTVQEREGVRLRVVLSSGVVGWVDEEAVGWIDPSEANRG